MCSVLPLQKTSGKNPLYGSQEPLRNDFLLLIRSQIAAMPYLLKPSSQVVDLFQQESLHICNGGGERENTHRSLLKNLFVQKSHWFTFVILSTSISVINCYSFFMEDIWLPTKVIAIMCESVCARLCKCVCMRMCVCALLNLCYILASKNTNLTSLDTAVNTTVLGNCYRNSGTLQILS